MKLHGESIEKIVGLSVNEFIKRVIIYIPESNFKMMRCYGYYARNSKLYKNFIIDFEKKRHKKWFYRTQLTWAMRIELMYDVDPLKWDGCGGRMRKEEIILPKKI